MKYLILVLALFSVMNLQANKDSIEIYLDRYEVKHKEIVLSQAILESGWFKCVDCSMDHNNPFGFFWKGEYKRFTSLDHAVRYYKTWQDKWYKGGNYYEFLKHIGYAEDPNYIDKLKSIKNQINNG